MTNKETHIKWARKVRPYKIRQLYENDAKGIVDQDLIDDVGYSLYARCEAIWMVTERRCLKCKEKCHKSEGEGVTLTCPSCGWSIPWETFKRSYKKKRIHGGRAYAFFVTYMEEFRRAQDPRQKMLAIDRVIHALHESLDSLWTTPASVNLIEGKRAQVIELLDSLAYGDTTGAVMMRNRKEQWRKKMENGEQVTREYYAKKKEK
jgi:hypothetical protein